jgi:NAD(P)H-binding
MRTRTACPNVTLRIARRCGKLPGQSHISVMRVLVIGATGGSGRAVCDVLLHRGHRVTAFARSATAMAPVDGLDRVDGDAADVELPRARAARVTTRWSSRYASPSPRGGCGCSARKARHTTSDPWHRRRRPRGAPLWREPHRRAVLLRSRPTPASSGDRGTARLRAAAEATDRRHRAAGAGRSRIRARVDTRAAGVPHRHRGRPPVTSTDGRTRLTRVSRRAVAAVHADLVESGAHRHDTVSVSG